MFLELVQRRNPKLLTCAIDLHQNGKILPDTYVLDLDIIKKNARLMAECAKEYNIELFYMTKQFGRNPIVAKAIEKEGITHSVVVDYQEALTMMKNGLKLGNVGHLVQIPKHLMEKIIVYGAKYITVFSIEKLKQINELAEKHGIIQSVLLKVIEPTDTIYDGQFAGFHLNEMSNVLEIVKTLKNIRVAGLTSFPCFLYDGKESLILTPNVNTLNSANSIAVKYGLSDLKLNMPSATCTKTIPFIHKIGGHQGEPGHALTGTTPLHAVEDLPELPAIVYISEISHHLDGKSYFFGGGHYRRGHFSNVLVGTQGDMKVDKVENLDDASIDYYFKTTLQHNIGDTVIGAFRTQIFVTRSQVAVVSGIQTGKPVLEGVFTSLGERVKW